jgi:hypothetical protein
MGSQPTRAANGELTLLLGFGAAPHAIEVSDADKVPILRAYL